jgi:N-acetylneuraminate lyase
MPVQDIQMFKAAGEQARGKNGFAVFNGPDEQFISGRVMGADGGIGGTYAAMPELLLKADALIRAGQIEPAREIQYAIDSIIYALCGCRGNMYAVIKEVLRRRAGLDIGGVRAPLAGLVPEDLPKVEACCAMIDTAVRKYC